MAVWSASGVEGRTLLEYVSDLNTVFQDALGADLDVSPESPQGQLISRMAMSFVQLDQQVVAAGNHMSVLLSSGIQLDDLVSIMGVTRIAATRSTVDVTITGVSGTALPEGWQVRTSPGDATFRLTSSTTIGLAGTVTGSMEAVDTGPVTAPIGSLTVPVTLISGFVSVTNAAAASLGRNTETDEELRRRYVTSVTRNSVGTTRAIRAALLELDGVSYVAVQENSSDASVTRQGITIPAHSIYVIVRGGSTARVTEAIARTKGASGTSGDLSAVIEGETIRFARPVEIPVRASVEGVAYEQFPGTGTMDITNALVEYVNALQPGTGINRIRMEARVAAVGGWEPTAVTLTRVTGSEGITTSDLDLNEKLTLRAAVVNIILTQG